MIYQTLPLHVIDLPADAAHTGMSRALDTIKAIILHSTEGSDSRAWLSTTSNPPVSIHRLIRRAEGEHYKILPDSRVAWHAGSGKWGNYALNDVSLGWELERQGNQGYTEYQMSEVTALTVEAWGRYGFLPVMGHGQVDPWRRSDPVRFDWQHYYQRVGQTLAQVLVAPVINADILANLMHAAGHIEAGSSTLASVLAALR